MVLECKRSQSKDQRITVLILLLVEYGLGAPRRLARRFRLRVLILLLVEYGLGDGLGVTVETEMSVS